MVEIPESQFKCEGNVKNRRQYNRPAFVKRPYDKLVKYKINLNQKKNKFGSVRNRMSLNLLD